KGVSSGRLFDHMPNRRPARLRGGDQASMKSWLALLALCTLLTTPSFSLDRAHFIELNKRGSSQAKQQDWKGLRETLIAIGHEMPAPTPIYMLRMASVETHLGNKAEAIRWLEMYASSGLRYNLAEDDDLKPLVPEPALAPVTSEMKERT